MKPLINLFPSAFCHFLLLPCLADIPFLLKCVLFTHFRLFIVALLLWFKYCNHCSLAYFNWCKYVELFFVNLAFCYAR
jgi:hypothetical protein